MREVRVIPLERPAHIYLELARRMSQHSLAEARRSVMDLRSAALNNQDLSSALQCGARNWTHGSALDVEVDVSAGADAQPGNSALKLATGEKVWSTPAPKVTCATAAACSPSQSAAVSVIPGAVFSGALNGHFRAYPTKTGEIIWDFDTARPFDTVNQVPGKGGSINGGGPAIANGMVFTNSGYGSGRQLDGNVLLAFSVDGK